MLTNPLFCALIDGWYRWPEEFLVQYLYIVYQKLVRILSNNLVDTSFDNYATSLGFDWEERPWKQEPNYLLMKQLNRMQQNGITRDYSCSKAYVPKYIYLAHHWWLFPWQEVLMTTQFSLRRRGLLKQLGWIVQPYLYFFCARIINMDSMQVYSVATC